MPAQAVEVDRDRCLTFVFVAPHVPGRDVTPSTRSNS